MKPITYCLVISLISPFGMLSGQGLDDTRAFADRLYAAGRYGEALPVYQRVGFFTSGTGDPGLLVKVADCFYFTGDLDRSLEYYDHAFYLETDDSLRTEILFGKAGCLLKSRNYYQALAELLGLESRDSCWYVKKLSFYLGMAWFGCGDYEQSCSCFEQAASSPEVALQIRNLFADRKLFHYPNPATASWLSVFFPGAGQFYCGEVAEGFNSLLLTASLVGLGILMAYYVSPLDAVVTLFPWFQRYYQGGFRRAGELARNRRAQGISSAFDHTLLLVSNSAR